jgi:hypothetical protein
MSDGTSFKHTPTTPVAASYLYDITPDGLLVIIDQDEEGASVTTEIQNVLAEIAHKEGLSTLAGLLVTYRDTEKDWCRVVLDDEGKYEQICGFGVRVTCEAEAMRRLRELA